jgi:hypothetical protein
MALICINSEPSTNSSQNNTHKSLHVPDPRDWAQADKQALPRLASIAYDRGCRVQALQRLPVFILRTNIMADIHEAMYQFLQLQHNRENGFDEDSGDEHDGDLDSSHGDRTSTAWVESKKRRARRQSTSQEQAPQDSHTSEHDLHWYDHLDSTDEDGDEAEVEEWHDDDVAQTPAFQVKVSLVEPGCCKGIGTDLTQYR